MPASIPTSPRFLALKTILRTDSGVILQEALNQTLASANLAANIKNFVSELVYGYYRKRIRLDYILRKLLPRPDKLPEPMLVYLKLAFYSLLFQKNSQDFAVINETVGIIKKNFGQKMANVGNAVLRSLQRKGSAPLDLNWYADKNKWRTMANFYAMPVEIVNFWLKSYGEEAALALLKRSSERPYTGVRINEKNPLAHGLREFFSNAKVCVRQIGQWGFVLPPGALPEAIGHVPWANLLRKGAVSLQAPGSLYIMEELGLKSWQKPVWDCCAGIGGKTAILLQYGVPVQLVSDISLKRLNYSLNHLKAAYPDLKIIQADAAEPPLKKWHGNIIADVPCSGLGVLARRPDIRKNSFDWRPYAKKQKEILEALYSVLANGAELAYITCTLNPHENEKAAADFVKKHRDMEITREKQTPHDHPWLEGMYGVVFKKKPGQGL